MRQPGAEGLTERISRQINDMIIERGLKPGDPLPTELHMIESFQVGRGVIREAIVRLRTMGIVDVRHGYGTFVAAMPVGLLQTRLRRAMEDQSEQAARHAMELREILLIAAVRLAAGQEGDRNFLHKPLSSLAEAVIGRAKALESFYVCLGQACGNPLIEQLLAGLGLILRARDEAAWSGAASADLLQPLADVDAAIREGRADDGVEAILRHLRGGASAPTPDERQRPSPSPATSAARPGPSW